MPIIRTPDERFENLPDFDFAPHYVEVNGMRVHYVDEGRGEVVLCLHGEPSWSFLYRKMIPPLVAAGHRVVAPDFIGFGRSDKLTEAEEYTYQMHFDTLVGVIEALDLQNITIVVQDWGGLMGLPVVGEMPERFARLVILNTALPTGEVSPSTGFKAWLRFVKRTPDLPVGTVIRNAMADPDAVSDEVIAAYEAPFPDVRYKAGAQIWPLMVPLSPDDPVAAIMKQAATRLAKWDKPAIVMFSDKDPILGGADRYFRKLIATTNEQPHIVIKDAGHFLQEEKGSEIAQHIVDFMARTPFDVGLV